MLDDKTLIQKSLNIETINKTPIVDSS